MLRPSSARLATPRIAAVALALWLGAGVRPVAVEAQSSVPIGVGATIAESVEVVITGLGGPFSSALGETVLRDVEVADLEISSNGPAGFQIRLESLSEEVYLTLDGQEGFPLTSRDLVRIRRCPEPVLLITGPQRSYFQILHRKLKWGERGG